MGLLTDIVVADETEAVAIAESPVPSQKWPGVDVEGIDVIKLGLLWAELSHQVYDPELVTAFSELHTASDEGPWVLRVPEPLAQLLADVNDATAASAAEVLVTKEEFEPDGWTVQDVRDVVVELGVLARQALGAGKSLVMWTSL